MITERKRHTPARVSRGRVVLTYVDTSGGNAPAGLPSHRIEIDATHSECKPAGLRGGLTCCPRGGVRGPATAHTRSEGVTQLMPSIGGNPPARFPRAARRPARAVAGLVALAIAVTGCGSGKPSNAGGQPADRQAGAAETLKGSCPDTIVVQTNWWPQDEYGGLYRLLGKDAKIDKDKKTVSAPLVAGGADTGVTLEVRAR